MFVTWKLLYSTVEVIVQPSPAYLKLLYVGIVPKAFCLIKELATSKEKVLHHDTNMHTLAFSNFIYIFNMTD